MNVHSKRPYNIVFLPIIWNSAKANNYIVFHTFILFSTLLLQATAYKDDFDAERKDRESAHSKIAEIEDRYRRQLETMAGELQKKIKELEVCV